MEHVFLEIAFLTMIGIFLISSLIQKYTRIPLPHSMIVLAFVMHNNFPELLQLDAKENFDHIMFFLIPLILMYDAMHLKWIDVKAYKWSIAYLAIFSVSLSILVGSSLYFFNIFGTTMTLAAYVVLFSMNMATDAISVGNIFSQFKGIPHNIKVLVEGESLGNDATAMIAFYFIGLPWLLAGSFDLTSIPWIAIKVFAISTVIGLAVAYAGYFFLKIFDFIKEEIVIILAVAYGSFVGAELIHVSGIFSLIVAMIAITALIDKSLTIPLDQKIKANDHKALRKFLKKEVSSKANQDTIHHTLDIFSFFAVLLVFTSMAALINFDNLFSYWKEILIMFAVTTLIRATVMAKFVLVGKKTKAIDYVGFNGWVILTLAGIKGSLSIIMLHALPKTFEFYELFESVTIGVILLSTFVYGFVLLGYMVIQEKRSAE